MKIPSKVKFCEDKLQKAFEKLEVSKNEEREMYKWLLRAFKDIEENAFCGIQTPKRLIPKEYLQKYKVHNLWKYNLPNAWRLIYSIEKEDILIVSIILEWMNHKDYERRFGY